MSTQPKITFTLPDGHAVPTQTQRRYVLICQSRGGDPWIERRSDDEQLLRGLRRREGFNSHRAYFLADRQTHELKEI